MLVVREIHTAEPTHPRVVAAASDPSSSVTDVATLAPARALQSSFDELGTPLRDVTFVVVDLETTGGAPADAGITEIGAVKVRAGEVVGEFATLIDPGVPIPPFIAVLTGITDAMLADAPRLGTALPAFLEFARGAVLVAHNAPYDTGFLKAACAKHGHAWPAPGVVDTARLARAALTRDEVRDCKLATLARHFRASTTPNHRALADARATVDVLHGLLERVGAVGVHTLEELLTFSGRVTSAQRRKRFLAEGLPDTPGVYVFRDAAGRPLYVGTSRRMRTRVRNYFTASEQRTRMAEMVGIAASVTPVECATTLEAQVRELRLIAEHRPRYNRRSKFPEKLTWLKLTVEPFPRLSMVREVRDDIEAGAAYVGPFGGRAAAERATEALLEAVPLRTCRARLSPRSRTTACVLLEMGRCGGPCDGSQPLDDYSRVADLARWCMTAEVSPVTTAVQARLDALVAQERFEDAVAWRERLAAFVRGAARAQRLAALARVEELVAAAPTPEHGWEVHVVRHGRLAAAAHAPAGTDPRAVVDAAVATAETVPAPPGGMPAGIEEAECVLRWLELPGVRLVHASSPWWSPAGGAEGSVGVFAAARAARRYDDDGRGLRPAARPSAMASRIAL